MNRIVFWAPLGAIALLLVVFAIALTGEREGTPGDPMTGRALPELPVTEFGAGFAHFDPDVIEGPYLLNFWASWCAPCEIEHPLLEELAAGGIPIHGITYADRPENSLAFLARLGNPFATLAADHERRAALELGVTGAPETFIIDGEGIIRARWRGAITPEIWDRRLAPVWNAAVREAEASPGTSGR
ncbi:thiol:disulfide interchange protein [Glycocaulis albus]|uniref:Thiol:disulfide interchange protein n=1 Tax=Glycocaulis albus TaxID=1382801 RepID=A0ABQ1XBS2_9PROT|nr:DsbE family thiol:disulfide interchange protein [Glycocaulis albus]MBV5256861.1 DsbE family thiol:disulfide interchange protein [Synechococcus moorigangaii CMS01]GGG89498.1 thiol:disulfide interchange protein [Glycocaulis albus]